LTEAITTTIAHSSHQIRLVIITMEGLWWLEHSMNLKGQWHVWTSE